MADIPDDLKAAYAAEDKAQKALVVERAKSVQLRATYDEQQAKVRKARVPFEATRATRRALEQEYGIGEYAASVAPTQTIGGD